MTCISVKFCLKSSPRASRDIVGQGVNCVIVLRAFVLMNISVSRYIVCDFEAFTNDYRSAGRTTVIRTGSERSVTLKAFNVLDGEISKNFFGTRCGGFRFRIDFSECRAGTAHCHGDEKYVPSCRSFQKCWTNRSCWSVVSSTRTNK